MKFDKIYIISFSKMAALMLPTFLRKKRQWLWLQTLIAPIEILYADFLKFRKRVNYKLNHNSQVCYLEAVLNDAFDSSERRIYISNGRFLQALYVYKTSEDLPVYIGKEYIYTDAELSEGTSDFIIHIPVEIVPFGLKVFKGFLNDVKATVNDYKLASKTYTIQWIR